MKTVRNPSSVHGPMGLISHQVEIDGPARWLVLSGQVGMKPDGSIPDDPAEQFAMVLENIRQNLLAADMEVADIVKLTIYMAGDFDMPMIQKELISPWLDGNKPCGTRIFVNGLVNPSLKVCVDAWACRVDQAG